MSCNWKLTEDRTLQIYNNKELYWEMDNCKAKTKKEIEQTVTQAIKDLSYLLEDI